MPCLFVGSFRQIVEAGHAAQQHRAVTSVRAHRGEFVRRQRAGLLRNGDVDGELAYVVRLTASIPTRLWWKAKSGSIRSIAADNATISPGIVAWSGRTHDRSSNALGIPKILVPLREMIPLVSAIQAPN
jgi:hypothetical protein